MITVFIVNPTNPDETWEVPTDEVRWTEELNTIKTGSFSIPFQTLKEMIGRLDVSPLYIIKGGLRKIYIYDNDYAYDPLIFAGWLRDYQFASTASEPSTISVNFADFGVMLSKRVSQDYHLYQDDPAGEIFKAELELAQDQVNGDMGLTLSALPETTLRQRTVERTNLLDLLTGMSNSKTKNGFDFDVDKNGRLTIYSPQRGKILDNIVLEARNTQQPQLNGKLTSGLANKVYVQGGELRDSEGNITQEAMQIVENDFESQAIWGVHEEYISATDVATEPFLRERGLQVLRERSQPNQTETITATHLGDDPDWRSYDVGDWLKVELPEYGITRLLRVKKRTINIQRGRYKITGVGLSKEEKEEGEDE